MQVALLFFSFSLVKGAIEPNGTKYRTFFGLALAKLNETKHRSALPIVTGPGFSQDPPFPLEVISPLSGDPDSPETIPTLLTISPDTAKFPDIFNSPLSDVSVFESSTMSSGLFERQSADLTPVAQNFPQTVPLPSAPAAGLPQCSCVAAGTCLTRSAAGVVEVRIVTQNPGITCPVGQQYCCSGAGLPALPQQDSCGLPNTIAGVFPATGQANLGEFPWSAIILNQANEYVGGAALVTSLHLLTAAHLVANRNGVGLKIRLGEWDISGSYEPVGFQEFAIANIVLHPQYTPVTLLNDLAIITLATPATILTNPTPHVNTVCLPASTDIFTGLGCMVAGWGKDAWNGNYQNIMKKVDLSVMGSVECQTRLRTTKLGANWNLDTTSFICAGGEAMKDACTGDGGNALVCPVNGRFVVAGITAGGVECGHPGIPGLYVNVASYLDWIAQQTYTPPAAGNIDPRKGG